MGDTARTALPPGPRLPAVVQAALMLREGPRFVSTCRKRYGSVFTIRVAMVGKLVYIDDPAEIKKGLHGESVFLPFGGGIRRRLGAAFAAVEMRIVLREVLRRVDLCTTTAAGERPKVKHVILIPHRGARIRLRANRDVPTAARTAANAPSCMHSS
jgi:cytochrome P450